MAQSGTAAASSLSTGLWGELTSLREQRKYPVTATDCPQPHPLTTRSLGSSAARHTRVGSGTAEARARLQFSDQSLGPVTWQGCGSAGWGLLFPPCAWAPGILEVDTPRAVRHWWPRGGRGANGHPSETPEAPASLSGAATACGQEGLCLHVPSAAGRAPAPRVGSGLGHQDAEIVLSLIQPGSRPGSGHPVGETHVPGPGRRQTPLGAQRLRHEAWRACPQCPPGPSTCK